MDLNIFNTLKANKKGNDIIQSFITELTKFLEKNIITSGNSGGADMGILEQIEADENLTVKYRDKILIERMNILNNYAQETCDKGDMYYVYSKNSKSRDIYNIYKCEVGKAGNIITAQKGNLPEGTGIDSVLRVQNGKYVLDIEDTEQIQNRTQEKIRQLLGDELQNLNNNRIEGHIYEVGPKEDDRVWLFDITNGNKNGLEAIEEIDIPKDLLEKVEEGDKLKYENGEYIYMV